jgi:hypothetical protein
MLSGYWQARNFRANDALAVIYHSSLMCLTDLLQYSLDLRPRVVYCYPRKLHSKPASEIHPVPARPNTSLAPQPIEIQQKILAEAAWCHAMPSCVYGCGPCCERNSQHSNSFAACFMAKIAAVSASFASFLALLSCFLRASASFTIFAALFVVACSAFFAWAALFSSCRLAFTAAFAAASSSYEMQPYEIHARERERHSHKRYAPARDACPQDACLL